MATSTQISVTAFGAAGDGVTDNTAALQAAFNYAARNNVSVYIPPGIYSHSGPIYASGIAVIGAGVRSILLASNPSDGAIFMQGNNVSLSNIQVNTIISPRYGTLQSAAVVVDHANGFTVKDVTVEKAGSVGIFVNSGTNGTIQNDTVLDTRADGISVTNAGDGTVSSGVTIQGNLIERSGDDSISVDSYLAGSSDANNHITITGNTVLEIHNGRGIAIAGGHDIQVTSNHVEGGSNDNAGITVIADSGFQMWGNWNTTVSGNTIKNPGSAGGIFVDNSYGPSAASNLQNYNLTITKNSIYNPPWDGMVLIGGSANHDLTIANNTVYNAGSGLALENVDGATNVTASGNGVLSDSSYSGDLVPVCAGSGMKLPAVSQHTITVTVSGDLFAAGPPVLRVMVDGEFVESDTTVNARHAAGQWQTLTITPYLLTGSQQLGLELVNDPADPAPGYGAIAGQSTAIYISSVSFDGKVISNGQITLNNLNITELNLPSQAAPTPTPTPAPTPTPTPTPSANGTRITSASGSPIVDKAGNAWTLVQSAAQGLQIATNGVVDTITSHVVQIEYLGGDIVQENTSGNWYLEPGLSDPWTQVAAPPAANVSPNGTMITSASAAPIIDKAGNAWTLMKSTSQGLQIATFNYVDAVTSNVTLLEYLNGKIVQENTSGNWYSEPGLGGPWSQVAAPQIAVTSTATNSVTTIGAATLGTHTVDGATFDLTAPGVVKVTLGTTPVSMNFTGLVATSLSVGKAAATVVMDGGTNSFTGGAGALTVTGGCGADAYRYHSGNALVTIVDFSLAKGDTLTVDKALQTAMTEKADGHSGLLVSFGSAGAGFDLTSVASLTASQIKFV